MFYTIYKITNNINSKIYIGCHKTSDINDNYMGSGRYLHRAFKKYGIENFSKEILHIFDTAEEMYAKEAELVNKEFTLDKTTYNLKEGGNGGFDYINAKKLNFSSLKNRQMSPFVNPHRYSSEWHALTHEKRKKGIEKAWSENRMHKFNSDINIDMRQRAQTPEAKEKRKATLKKIKFQQGQNNSQFGTMWITNGTENKKIKKDAVIPEGWSKGRK